MRPLVIPRSGHPISRRNVDPDALKVLQRLYRAGHVAYLVGGSVRDLLLGIRPKDFDVATDAHPNRLKKLFRNCVLVGRRFRLAHVRFGSKVIEVSTFRRAPDPEAEGSESDLLIQRDNTFGTPEDDAVRRDFTVNALFYDIGTFSIIDYVGGLRDLEDGFVRSIGEPAVRYQEDPVRMIRAVKFAARLGFDIVPEDLDAIRSHRDRIRLASVPRLLEEIYKLLRGGAAAAAFKLLQETGLLAEMLPDVSAHLDRTGAAGDPESADFYRHLFALDAALRAEEPLAPTNSLLLAAVLLPLLEEALREEGSSTWEASPEDLDAAVEQSVVPTLRRLTVARRDVERLRHVLLAQAVLAAAPGRRSAHLQTRPWFHEAVTLLGFAATVHEPLQEAAAEWSRRAAEVEPVAERRPAPRRRRRRRPDEPGPERVRRPRF